MCLCGGQIMSNEIIFTINEVLNEKILAKIDLKKMLIYKEVN